MDREQQSQPGTGSTGRSREEQLNPDTNLTQQQREDILGQPGLGRDRMGGLSGRDDLSGDDNDGMTEQGSSEGTGR